MKEFDVSEKDRWSEGGMCVDYISVQFTLHVKGVCGYHQPTGEDIDRYSCGTVGSARHGQHTRDKRTNKQHMKDKQQYR